MSHLVEGLVNLYIPEGCQCRQTVCKEVDATKFDWHLKKVGESNGQNTRSITTKMSTKIMNVLSFLDSLCLPLSSPSWWGFKYNDCTPYKGIRPSPKMCVLGMTLNCIWWWGSTTGDLGSVEYVSLPLLPGPLWLRVVVTVRVPYIG